MRSTAFFKIYKICILLRCNLKNFAKNQLKMQFSVKFSKFCKCRKILPNFKNFNPKSVDFENADKRIFTCKNRCRYSRRATFCRNFADQPLCHKPSTDGGCHAPEQSSDASSRPQDHSSNLASGTRWPGRPIGEEVVDLTMPIYPFSQLRNLSTKFEQTMLEILIILTVSDFFKEI